MPRRVPLLFAGIVCLYLLIAISLSATKRPWFDEAMFANPAWDLVTRGSMGLTITEPTGFPQVPGIEQVNVNRHVYYSMPLSNLGMGAWYWLVGFGMVRTRLYHVLWGLAALGAWTFLVRTLARSWWPALLAALLVATDRGFVDAAASGRPDMMSAALGTIAMAAYMALREHRLGTAIFTSQALIALALFTHPIGAAADLGVLVLLLRFDFRRLRWAYLPLAAVPFFVGFALWGLYILQDPPAFRSQFGANASGREQGLRAPLAGIIREVRVRFLERLYLPPYATGVRRLSVLIPVFYWLSAVLLAFRRSGPRLLGVLAILYFFAFSILESTKPPFYLVHITPLLACCLALWSWSVWRAGGGFRWAGPCVVAVVLGIQLVWIAGAIRQDTYHKAYLPAMAFLSREAQPGSLIIGNSELGFYFGFFGGHVVDDASLGYYSGKRADFLAVDVNGYREAFKGFASRDPGLDRYVRKTLTDDYRIVYENPVYTIYRRR
jgi:hypothetical protein